MTLNEYQQQAMTTAIYPNKGTGNVTYPALGLAGEAGEITNKVKKVIRDDGGVLTEERRVDLVKELGDCCWYVAVLAEELDTNLEEVCQMNLDKLAARKAKNTLGGSGDNR